MKLSVKAAIRSSLLRTRDMFCRTPFASSKTNLPTPLVCGRISQVFKPSETLENKKHNLREAASRINRTIIRPGEIFSFWRTVGNPNNSRRFRDGRCIVGGNTIHNLGGGLCQASGIIHHLALMAGLEIVERHNHSKDLYTEQTRFAPLGTDATVMFGFKDLRIRNNTGGEIRFVLTITEDHLIAKLHSSRKISLQELSIEKCLHNDKLHVCIRRDGRIVSKSIYIPYSE